jgi:hypothetical protein
MALRQRTYVLLTLAVIVSSIVTYYLRPTTLEVPHSCPVKKPTLAVEVCSPREVESMLAEGTNVLCELRTQTVADFLLVFSYVGLWAATSWALHPAVAGVAVVAGAADVVENVGILREIAQGDAIFWVQWAGLTKWALLGIVFLGFVCLFRPYQASANRSQRSRDRGSSRWRTRLADVHRLWSWERGTIRRAEARALRIATGLAYGTAGLFCLVGLVHRPVLDWVLPPMTLAVILQLALHLFAHDEFEAFRRLAPSGGAEPGAQHAAEPILSLADVLRDEYGHLRGHVLGDPCDPGLPHLYEAIHALDAKPSALCLSGGGIRSATFGLGVMQGLAERGILDQFDYLSTVSGGGYIGGWLTAWLRHKKNDVKSVAEALVSLDPARRFQAEPPAVLHLRAYSNYLAPRPGLLSADTWTLAATFVRNLVLVWLVLVPLLAAALTLPRLFEAMIQDAPASTGGIGRGVLVLGALLLAWAVAYIAASIPSMTTTRRDQRQFLTLCLLPLLLSTLCLTLYWAWWPRGDLAPPLPSVWRFMAFAIIVHLAAAVGYGIWLRSRVWDWLLDVPGIVVGVGAAGGALAYWIATSLFPEPQVGVHSVQLYACLAPAVFLAIFLLAAALLAGLLTRYPDHDYDMEWWARCGGWLLMAGLGWLAVSFLVLFGPMVFSGTWTTSRLTSAGGVVSGVIAVVGGWSAKSTAHGTSAPPLGPVSRLRRLVLPAAALVFAAFIVVALSALTSRLFGWLGTRMPSFIVENCDSCPAYPSPFLVATVALGLGALGICAGWLIDTNKLSLHAMYRSRLIRAYLGASNPKRRSDLFTGYDENDDIQMHQLWPNQHDKHTNQQEPRRKLFHVVNMALNLVHGDRLAWQERKAHSFTVTPLHAGSVAFDNGRGAYRRTSRPHTARKTPAIYGGPEGISLGTAMTISGAAASPNMGYHSSPLVTFLMTLFNVRLGAWLGNPGKIGASTFSLAGPRVSIRPVLAEAFGLTTDSAPYVYLSDGGHFDNLGLYEMVLRRCKLIVVSDASCDPKCELIDLGSTIRKIRTDLSIPIEFGEHFAIYPRTADDKKRAEGVYWAMGRIRYSQVDKPVDSATDSTGEVFDESRDGWLLYVKAAFYGTEPRDIYEYAMANEQFPHESTVDQFFSESQFESYRMLGLHAMRCLCEDWRENALEDLVRHAAEKTK